MGGITPILAGGVSDNPPCGRLPGLFGSQTCQKGRYPAPDLPDGKLSHTPPANSPVIPPLLPAVSLEGGGPPGRPSPASRASPGSRGVRGAGTERQSSGAEGRPRRAARRAGPRERRRSSPRAGPRPQASVPDPFPRAATRAGNEPGAGRGGPAPRLDGNPPTFPGVPPKTGGITAVPAGRVRHERAPGRFPGTSGAADDERSGITAIPAREVSENPSFCNFPGALGPRDLQNHGLCRSQVARSPVIPHPPCNFARYPASPPHRALPRGPSTPAGQADGSCHGRARRRDPRPGARTSRPRQCSGSAPGTGAGSPRKLWA